MLAGDPVMPCPDQGHTGYMVRIHTEPGMVLFEALPANLTERLHGPGEPC